MGALSTDTLGDRELRAWRGLLRAHATLTRVLDAELESAHGLALSSYEVLVSLDDASECRMRMCDLADRAGLSRSGLTRLVDRLERDGLIERVSCAHDARGAFAVLTPTGRERLRAARETHEASVRVHFVDRVEPDQLAALAAAWEQLAD